MNTVVIPHRRQERRGTAAALASLNEILRDGEICIEKDTGRWKIGDGVTTWLLLPYMPGRMGTHAVPIQAGSMMPSASSGCAPLSRVATSANHPDLVGMDFDPTAIEYAQFMFPMPESWDGGTFTYTLHWRHGATATNFKTAWALQAVAIGNDDAIDVAYGTAVQVNDTGGTTNDFYTTPESADVTAAGTPQPGGAMFFRVQRVASDGTNDTLAVDATLLALTLYLGTDAADDA